MLHTYTVNWIIDLFYAIWKRSNLESSFRKKFNLTTHFSFRRFFLLIDVPSGGSHAMKIIFPFRSLNNAFLNNFHKKSFYLPEILLLFSNIKIIFSTSFVITLHNHVGWKFFPLFWEHRIEFVTIELNSLIFLFHSILNIKKIIDFFVNDADDNEDFNNYAKNRMKLCHFLP